MSRLFRLATPFRPFSYTSRKPAVVGAMVVMIAVLPTVARAQGVPPTTTNVMWACYTPSGSVYRINVPGGDPAPGAPADCTKDKHVKFSWNRLGAVGPTGATGATGAYPSVTVTGVGQVFTSPVVGQSLSFNTDCSNVSPTSKILAGGARIINQGASQAVLTASEPHFNAGGIFEWSASALVITGGSGSVDFSVRAVCTLP